MLRMGDMDEQRDNRYEAWRLFLKTHSVLIGRLGDELEAAQGLPLTWFDVLIQLNKTPEGHMRMNDLADSVLLSKSGVTRLIDRMERGGLVERATCPTDRRVVYAQLTKRGRSVLAKASPFHFDGVEAHFTSHLSPSESRALVSALRKILDAQTARSEEQAAS
jgi:DNA-binding MarR family transcriptional regulator